jgi:hypothetical protein
VERSAEQLAVLLRQCLQEGRTVDIDGLGVFRPAARGGYEFVPRTAPRVFIAYVFEDGSSAERLYKDLLAFGLDPWLDKRKLLPGQNWPRAIERAIEVSDFFVACFSRSAVNKRGQFQSELRYALDCARRMPLDEIFLIPLRLDECRIPLPIQQSFHYVDMFPDWDRGLRRILAAMEQRRTLRTVA